MEKLRLNKYLASVGIAARRKVDEMIRASQVKVNGVVAKLGMVVTPDRDKIEVKGRVVGGAHKPIYIMVNKPVGVVAAVTDEQRKTVVELVNWPDRLFPVGRLDVDSEGLVLLTNDGELAYRLTHPKFGVVKEYEVEVVGRLTQMGLAKLREGVRVGGEKTLPAVVERMGEGKLRLVIKEGKNRQVRRMCKAVNLEVVKLKRVAIGNLRIGDLKPGEWREVSGKVA